MSHVNVTTFTIVCIGVHVIRATLNVEVFYPLYTPENLVDTNVLVKPSECSFLMFAFLRLIYDS